MKFDKSKLPSRHVSIGVKSAPHRSMYHAMGLKNEDIEKPLKKYFDDYQTISLPNFKISNDEMEECIGSQVKVHPCDKS